MRIFKEFTAAEWDKFKVYLVVGILTFGVVWGLTGFIEEPSGELLRYVHDDKRAVGCWVYNDVLTRTSGMSCLPDSAWRK